MEIVPRYDGLIYREQAAALCGVTPETISIWVHDGYGPGGAKQYLKVERREGNRPLFNPVEVAKAEHATARRARRGRWAA